MKFKIGDTVDYKSRDYKFKSCTVVGHGNTLNDYIIQVHKKYKKITWTSDKWHKVHYGVTVGTKMCRYADELFLILSKPNKRGKNPRGKNGKFIKTNTLEDRVTALEEYIGKIKTLLNI